MISIFQKQTDKISEGPLLSEGRYHGDAKASIHLFGHEAKTEASVEVTITRKPGTSNTFDASLSATQTYVTPGLGFFFPFKQLGARGEITVDESKRQLTLKGTIPALSLFDITKTVDVSKESDGSISAASSLGQLSASGRIIKQSTLSEANYTPR